MTRLALIADLHVREGYADRIEGELERTVERLAGFDPDRAFVLGDLVEEADAAATDRERVRRIDSALGDAPFPVTYLLGNHDVVNLDRSTFAGLLGQDSFHGLVDVDGTPVLFLDSSWTAPEGARGHLGTEQRAWLHEVLPGLSDALVLVHHPVGPFDLSESPWFADYPERAFLGDRKEVFEAIEEHGGVRATVSGHVHQHGRARFGGVEHVSLNAFSKEAPGVPVTGTYAEVVVDDEVAIDVKTPEGTVASYAFE